MRNRKTTSTGSKILSTTLAIFGVGVGGSAGFMLAMIGYIDESNKLTTPKWCAFTAGGAVMLTTSLFGLRRLGRIVSSPTSNAIRSSGNTSLNAGNLNPRK